MCVCMDWMCKSKSQRQSSSQHGDVVHTSTTAKSARCAVLRVTTDTTKIHDYTMCKMTCIGHLMEI